MPLSFPALFVILIQQFPFHVLPVVFVTSSMFLSTLLFRGVVAADDIIARFVSNAGVQISLVVPWRVPECRDELLARCVCSKIELSKNTDSEVYTQNLVVGLALSMLMRLLHQTKLEITCVDSDHLANGIDAVHQRSHASETSMQL